MISRRNMIGAGVCVAAGASLAVVRRAWGADKPKILVTGDMGVVGTRILPILARDYTVLGLDRRRAGQDLAKRDGLSMLGTEASGLRAVIHLAWDNFGSYSDSNAMVYNTWLLREAVTIAQTYGAGRIIFASSALADATLYGFTGSLPEPNYYTAAKLAHERMMLGYEPPFDMKRVGIRFGQVKRGNEATGAGWPDKIVMTDADLTGLLTSALLTHRRFSIIGPYDAR